VTVSKASKVIAAEAIRPYGPVRYVRTTLTAASGSWFSVADVRAYTAS